MNYENATIAYFLSLDGLFTNLIFSPSDFIIIWTIPF